MNVTEITHAILTGEQDKNLERIGFALRERTRRLHRQKAAAVKAQLKPGVDVRVVGRTKPQYLEGLTGCVVEVRQTRVLVNLHDGPIGKFKLGRVLMPFGALEVI